MGPQEIDSIFDRIPLGSRILMVIFPQGVLHLVWRETRSVLGLAAHNQKTADAIPPTREYMPSWGDFQQFIGGVSPEFSKFFPSEESPASLVRCGFPGTVTSFLPTGEHC